MATILELEKQIEKVILLLKQRLIDAPDRSVLKTLYERYVRAEEILNNNGDIKKNNDYWWMQSIFGCI